MFHKRKNRVAEFDKVSIDRFLEDASDLCGLSLERVNFACTPLPCRATSGSCGYDFFSTCDVVVEPGETAKIPTGIRVRIKDGWFLMCVPKSGLGSKYKMRLSNTVGIIDSDYYYSDNEGHIIIVVSNEGKETLKIDKLQKFCQGIFIPYGITEFDTASESRNGGFGSTGK